MLSDNIQFIRQFCYQTIWDMALGPLHSALKATGPSCHFSTLLIHSQQLSLGPLGGEVPGVGTLGQWAGSQGSQRGRYWFHQDPKPRDGEILATWQASVASVTWSSQWGCCQNWEVREEGLGKSKHTPCASECPFTSSLGLSCDFQTCQDRNTKANGLHDITSEAWSWVLWLVNRSSVYLDSSAQLLPYIWKGFCWDLPPWNTSITSSHLCLRTTLIWNVFGIS
jgi:hypothetical protein